MVHEHELTKNALVKGQIAIISTSHADLGSTGEKTGLWLEELAAPYYIFKEAGYDVTIASVKGGVIPLDAASLSEGFLTPAAKRFQEDQEAEQFLHNSVPLASLTEVQAYAAFFVPGGHGAVWDTTAKDNPTLAKLLSDAYAAGKVVSSVCHGPSCLVGVLDASGKPLVQGKKVTGFTNTEEVAVGKDKIVPFSLEDELVAAGADFQRGPDWGAFAVEDGHLVTGQNPGSSALVAEKVLAILAAKSA